MINTAQASDWRQARRRSAREMIVDAAWALVRQEGLAGLSLRDLARRAGITTPTVYAYFESKDAIYDAMFAQVATLFADRMAEPYDRDEPHDLLVAVVRRFFEFCTGDPARYQLLFQRTLPGFEPSPEAYAPAVRALEDLRARLCALGITDAGELDLWTALVTGLVDQQVSNDPGGDRWSRLIEEAVAMFLAHCGPIGARPPRRPRSKGAPS